MEGDSPTPSPRYFVVGSLLVASLLTQVYSSDVNDTITSKIENNDVEETNIIGLNNVEEWPVIRVEFPGKIFPNSLLEGLFEGESSAEDYIAEISGGRSSLNVTIMDEIWTSQY